MSFLIFGLLARPSEDGGLEKLEESLVSRATSRSNSVSLTLNRNKPSHDFLAVIESMEPTAIVGVRTQGKAFTRQVVESTTRLGRGRSSLHSPILRITQNARRKRRIDGLSREALYVAGVPFPPVRLGDKTILPGQGNSLYAFPALGLTIYAARPKRVTEEMFIAAAPAVADQVTEAELDAGLLYSPHTDILNTEIATAVRFCQVVFVRGLAGGGTPWDLRAFAESQLYKPEYLPVT